MSKTSDYGNLVVALTHITGKSESLSPVSGFKRLVFVLSWADVSNESDDAYSTCEQTRSELRSDNSRYRSLNAFTQDDLNSFIKKIKLSRRRGIRHVARNSMLTVIICTEEMRSSEPSDHVKDILRDFSTDSVPIEVHERVQIVLLNPEKGSSQDPTSEGHANDRLELSAEHLPGTWGTDQPNSKDATEIAGLASEKIRNVENNLGSSTGIEDKPGDYWK
ncbi:hypothetical protein [Halorubrum saccharovorum]|uniref:hypothetical protein n=1 Tax=Halorubrum saccharovorum TaxID=2248 RepID=UPI0012689703|nr:hypothetical protein [Halorubrum saccharovorum]